MLIYFTIFILGLVCIFLSMQIVLLTKKTLDRSYKFFMFAAVVFSFTALLRFFNEAGIDIDENIVKYIDLLFVILFLDGLIFMSSLIKKLENEKIKNEKVRAPKKKKKRRNNYIEK